MTNKEKSLRAARIAKWTGIIGFVVLMGIAVALCFALRGRIIWPVMAAALFGAGFHLMGCLFFSSYFKASVSDDDA